MNTNDKGKLNELNIKKELVKRGFTVSEPINQDSRYDLILDTSEGLKKLQCKHPQHKEGKIVIRNKSISQNTKDTKRKEYKKEEVDYFATYSQKTEKLYIIPFSEASETKTSLRYKEAEINHPNINKAEDYEFNAGLV